jgi:hypothetical protein
VRGGGRPGGAGGAGRGRPFPPIHPWSLEPASGDDLQDRV